MLYLELTTVLQYLGLNYNPEEIQATFDEFDTDGSGTIEFSEFLVLMHKKVYIMLK